MAPLGTVPAGQVAFDAFVPGAGCDDPGGAGAFVVAGGAVVVAELVLAAF
jgi:hypothetical protein